MTALFLAAMMTAGVLTGYMPADAKEVAGEETVKAVEIPESANYVEGEAIVCYKAAETESFDQAADTVLTTDEEEEVKQETETVLEEERYVDQADAILLVENAGFVAEAETSGNAASDLVTEESEAEDPLPGVITLVRSENLTTAELIAELEAREDVLYAEPNYIHSVQSADYSDRQWGETTTYGIGADGWNTYSGDTPTPPVPTDEQVVAIVDTGVDYTHEDLRNVMWNQGLAYPELTQLGGGTYGYNSVGITMEGKPYDTADPMDDAGHGTHCAGIVAGEWNGQGVSGVTSGAKIMAIKVGNSKGYIASDAVVRGYQYVITAKKAGVNVVVTNNSFGGEMESLSGAIMAKEAERWGIVTVYSSGNESSDLDTTCISAVFTGRPDSSIVVGANDIDGKLAEFSNYGRRDVDVFAPGVDIWSTIPMGTGVPTEYTSILSLEGQQCSVDYSIKDTVSDPVLGLTVENAELSIQEAGDGKKVLHAEAQDLESMELNLVTKQFSDLTGCKGGYLEFYSDTEGRFSYTVSERDSEGVDITIDSDSVVIKKGLNRMAFVYPSSTLIYSKKDVQIVVSTAIRGLDRQWVPSLDVRQFRLNDATENYEGWDGTSMATPLVTGGVAVLAAVFPDDSPAKRAARVTGSTLPVEDLSDKCLSGGIFRLDKAIAEETVPVPQHVKLEGKTLTAEGFFFGTKKGTITLDGTACQVKSWTDEKITAELPEDYEPGEKVVTVTSDKGSGHGYFRLGEIKELWPRLVLPGSTISGSGEYEISDAALEEYADFYQGNVRGIIGLDGYIYAFVEMLNGGTAVFRYQIENETWEKVCRDTEYSPSSGVAAWNGKILITGLNPRGNKAVIGVFDPETKKLNWTITNENEWEDQLGLVNNGYGIYLIGGKEGIYGNAKMVNHFLYIRRVDPETMQITNYNDPGIQIKGCFPCICADEDGTIYAFPGNKIISEDDLNGIRITFDGKVPSEGTDMDLTSLFEGISKRAEAYFDGVMTKDGLLVFGPTFTDETGGVITDSYLVSADGEKLVKQSRILSYRPTSMIVTTAYQGVCYVMGMNISETKDYLFAGINGDVIEPYGEKAYANEWADGIRYGKDGFRTKSRPYKAEWKSNKKGRWYQDESGWYPKNCWQKIDGEWYFFGKDGYLETDAYRSGWYLGKDGSYDGKAQAGWKHNSKGWWYQLPDGSYLKETWKKIDGKWYYFKADGYMAEEEWVRGYYWLNRGGVWTYQPKGSWHKDKKGWWFGDTSGWYAKNKSYVINGKTYTFNSAGYCTNP